jgi:hypothetical protein
VFHTGDRLNLQLRYLQNKITVRMIVSASILESQGFMLAVCLNPIVAMGGLSVALMEAGGRGARRGEKDFDCPFGTVRHPRYGFYV